jgi:hypothetical protein
VGWDRAGVREEGMDWVGGESGRCGKERESRMEEGGEERARVCKVGGDI